METNADQLSELMQRYARGEDGVFEALYRLMAPRVDRFCLRLTTGKSEADDLLQETMLRVHRARATYLAGSNALHWAFAISRSVHLDRLRYRRRRPEALGFANDAAEHDRLSADDRYMPEAEVLARDLVRVVTVELARTSEKNRIACPPQGGRTQRQGGGRGTRNDGGCGAATRPSSLHTTEDRAWRCRMEGARR
jgi:RNA polymerase sigma-70 factor, ECF subfamily